MASPGLLDHIRRALRHQLASYPDGIDAVLDDGYLVPPALQDRSGVVGALCLAQAGKALSLPG